jgi:type IV secretory pathway TraG/TraD family ATPase VirD4
MRIDSDGKMSSAFSKFFGPKSLETARRLLTEALKTENDSEIKAEIERRLNLLEPNPVIQIKCVFCKKFFRTIKERGFKQKICPKCMKRYRSQKQQNCQL